MFAADYENSPATLTPDLQEMQYELDFVRAVAKGWPHVAERFLKPFGAEAQADFKARQARPNFSDFLNPVAEAATGRLFRNEPELTPSSGRAAEIWNNIDGRGTSGSVWLRNLTRDALIAGQAFILVDYPQVTEPLTRGQRYQQNLQSYWCSVTLDQVTNFDFTVINGQTLLTLFVFKEWVDERVDFKVTMVEQWRVLRLQPDGSVTFELWRRATGIKGEPVLYQPPQPVVGAETIPVVSVNLRPQGFFKSRPVFIELAQQTVDYYLTTSDMSRAHEMSSYPTLFAVGLPEKTESGEPLVVGPNSFVSSNNANAKLEYVNSDGKGVELGMQLLAAIRSKMAVNGLSFLEQTTQMAETATAKSIDRSTDNDKVAGWSQLITDAANQALEFTAQFEEIPTPTLEFKAPPAPAIPVAALQQPDPAAIDQQVLNQNAQQTTF